MSLDANIQHDWNGKMPIWRSKEILGKLITGEIEKENPLVKRALDHSRNYDAKIRNILYGELLSRVKEYI